MALKKLFYPIALFFITFGIGVSQSMAAGFYLSEVGTPGSLGTAGVANPVNNFAADSSWTNPAGMTGVQEDQILAGLTFLLPKVEFEASVAEAGGSNGGNGGEIAGIPSFFFVKKMSDRMRLGFSVVAPIGGGADFGSDFVGRYGAYKIELAALSFSPAVAYKVNDKLSLGAGISIIYTFFNQEIAINLPDPLADGTLKMDDLDDWGYQPFLGLTYEINDKNLIGLVYRAEADTDLEGDLKFSNVPVSPTINSLDISWKNPQWIEVGFRHTLENGLMLALNAGWQEWSAFSENRLTIDPANIDTNPTVILNRNFDNTWHAGIALGHISENRGWSVGFSYDSSPVEDEHRTIDLAFDEQYKFSGSYGWKKSEKLSFALGGTLVYFGEGKVDQMTQGLHLVGEFDKYYAFMLGGTVHYLF
ncbi:MAG: outer membrane protein transport protein [Desulfobacterales bacterium]|nr:MAG: outer membrane protein transport protein [Desulfobacterales bacterium]